MSRWCRRLALRAPARWTASILLTCVVGCLGAADPVWALEVTYIAKLLPDRAIARVRVVVEQTRPELSVQRFGIDPEQFFDFDGDGEIAVEDDRVTWRPPEDGGELRYSVLVDHLRDPSEYDARCTSRWALFRGEDLFPPSTFRNDGDEIPPVDTARLRLHVPADWSVVTPLARTESGAWWVPGRASAKGGSGKLLDTPRGWMLAGELDVVEGEVAGSQVRIGAPGGDDVHIRDRLAFLRVVLPVLREVVGPLPPRLVVVMADDPMWRGGLSGPDSLYLHADRPMLDRDGSSPVIHELVHVAMSADSEAGADSLVEGLAEYYAVTLLRRAGLTSDSELERSLAALRERGEGAERLHTHSADAAERARTVALLAGLDAWLRARPEATVATGLDAVVRELAGDPADLTPERFVQAVQRATGIDPRAFLAERAPSLFEAEAAADADETAATPD